MVGLALHRVRWGAAALALLLGTARASSAHPLHTSITEVTHDARSRTVEVVIRLFEDDFRAAVARERGASPAGYLARRFQLTGADRKPVPLRWTGSRRTEDLIWIHLRGTAPAGLKGGKLRNEIAHELFADQVNIVKLRSRGREHTLLFTRGAGTKRLP